MHATQKRRADSGRFSLRWLVPALSAIILAAAIAAFGTMAYGFARASALETAAARLTTVAEAFAQPVQPGPSWARLARGIASSQAVLHLVRSDGREVGEGIGRQLGEFFADTAQSLGVEVRRADGSLLYSVASPRLVSGLSLGGDRAALPVGGQRLAATATVPDSLRLIRAYADSAMTSELYSRGGQVLYERAVPIRDSGRVVAHLVEIRRLTLTPAAQRQLVRLVGQHAALVIGNADGSLWVDLNNSVPHTERLDVAAEYTRDGRRWLSATTNLPAAPWRLSVEFPVDEVLAPVHLLGRRLFAVGVLVVLAGVIVSERLSRRLTVPLSRLTVAAENIAAGDRTTPAFEVSRGDEIGRLSRAFAMMAESIHETQDTLEHTIGHRTGELHTALGRLRDAQDELLRKERLATLGQLSSSIAHELRNPLGVMTNALYYLETVLRDAPPKVHEHLGKLRTQVRLSESIIRGLLDSTRATAGALSEIDVAALIDEELARVEVPATIRVERHVAPGLPPIRADRVQVGQVLVNLFSNAIQAMEHGTGVLSVRTAAESGSVRITVADTGPGIAAEHREKIFEPLFTTKARGIGLGLSVSRTLTQANGGDLSVDNRSEGGAAFTLVLPARHSGGSAAGGSAAAESPVHGLPGFVARA